MLPRRISVPFPTAAAHSKEGGASPRKRKEGTLMSWTTPTLVEVCIGLEINGYLPAEF